MFKPFVQRTINKRHSWGLNMSAERKAGAPANMFKPHEGAPFDGRVARGLNMPRHNCVREPIVGQFADS